MNKQMVIFFDIDGTIMPENISPRRVPDDTLAAIREAQARGHLCLINTGRGYGCLGEYLRGLGMDGIVSGCGAMAEIGGKLLWKDPPMSAARSREVIAAARECGVWCVYEGYENRAFDAVFDPPTPEQREASARAAASGGIPDVFLDDDSEFEILKLIIDKKRGGDYVRMAEMVPELDFLHFNDRWMECPPVGCDKGRALIRVMDHLGLPLAQSIAVGDSSNDLPMLRVCPNSVAMGNGAAKEHPVSFVTLPCDAGGIAHMMRHFGLID